MTTQRLPGLIVVVIAATLIAVTLAKADIVTWNDADGVHLRVHMMPDLDQRRVGPICDGWCHCVPTSILNKLIYIASRGYPDLHPGPGPWQSNEKHSEVTSILIFLGQGMLVCCSDLEWCSPTSCGTGGPVVSNFLQDYLDAFVPGLLTTSVSASSGGYSVLVEQIAASVNQTGMPHTFGFGHYRFLGFATMPVGSGFVVVPSFNRVGGHAVTFSGYTLGPDISRLYARDPAADENAFGGSSILTTQSPFKNTIYDATRTHAAIMELQESFGCEGLCGEYNEDDDCWCDDSCVVWNDCCDGGIECCVNNCQPIYTFNTFRLVDMLNFSGQFVLNQNVRVLDSYRKIVLKYGYTFDSLGGKVNTVGGLTLAIPPWHEAPPPLEVPGLAAVTNVQVHPNAHSFLVHLGPQPGAGPGLYQVNRLTAEWTQIDTGQFTPTHFALGRNRVLYMGVSSQRIHPLGFVDDEPEVGDFVTSPFPFQAMEYIDCSDELVVAGVDPASGQLHLAAFKVRVDDDHGLDPEPVANGVTPGGVNFPMGDGSVRFNPADCSLWMAIGSNSLVRAWKSPADESEFLFDLVAMPADVEAIDFDDRGHLYAVMNGVVREFAPDGSGGWASVGDSPFANEPAGSVFRMTRSRSNFVAEHEEQEWTTNIDADELEMDIVVPDCPADVAPDIRDGVVDIFDLLKVLSEWGPCPNPFSCLADVNDDGVVDIFDLLKVLSEWGPCPAPIEPR